MNREEARSRTEELRRLIAYHSKKYYDEDAPELEDDEFDALTRELRELVSRLLLEFSKEKAYARVTAFADCNPDSIL